MSTHPAFAEGRVAVITGAASGIGLAAAHRFAAWARAYASPICRAARSTRRSPKWPVRRRAGRRGARRSHRCEPDGGCGGAARRGLRRIRRGRAADEQRGDATGGGPFDHVDRWRRVLDVNLWGVINGLQTFAPAILAQRTACAIVNTGPKQGITCPPGDTAYNVSKAGVKVLTEALAHGLRNEEGARISANLLIPVRHSPA